MKKPNITEGSWSVKRYHALGQWSDEDPGEILIENSNGISLASIDPYGTGANTNMGHANAKAISAVPEMIDALCLAYQSIKNLEDNQDLFIPAKTDIKDALKKAGVEL